MSKTSIKTTTSQMRRMLLSAMEKVSKGELGNDEARSLIGLANQTTTNMAVELKAREQFVRMGSQAAVFGELEID